MDFLLGGLVFLAGVITGASLIIGQHSKKE